MRRLILILTILAMLATACGDDGDDTATADPAGDDAADDAGANDDDSGDTDDSGADGGADAIGCPPQGFEGTVNRLASGDHADASFATDDVWVDGVVAARLGDGVQYTFYVSDHEYLGDPRDFDTLVADAGGTLANVFVGLQSGYVAGQPISDTDDGAFISAIIDSGGGASSSTMDASGTATPIAWSDDWVCVDVDYADSQQQVTGTISAPIVSGF